jgi:hypothetical protein
MLTHDPVPWLIVQEGLAAVRARRMLGLKRDGDEDAVAALEAELNASQLPDGSFEHSLMKTAGVLNLLDDLGAGNSEEVIEGAASYLLSVLQSQRGYECSRAIKPGALRTPCDLCGFFGPYDDRNQADVMARGAREMNFFREYEPLLGPKSPVRAVRRSNLDRPGPGSCYAWGLIPLTYTVETLCRAGHAREPRLKPAINALLGAQRQSGGWCRGLGGHPSCTVHGVRALGSHPILKRSRNAERALEFVQQEGARGFAVIQAAAAFDFPVARDIIREGLAALAPRQRKNGTFGTPCKVERVAAALAGEMALRRGTDAGPAGRQR